MRRTLLVQYRLDLTFVVLREAECISSSCRCSHPSYWIVDRNSELGNMRIEQMMWLRMKLRFHLGIVLNDVSPPFFGRDVAQFILSSSYLHPSGPRPPDSDFFDARLAPDRTRSSDPHPNVSAGHVNFEVALRFILESVLTCILPKAEVL